MGIQLLNRFQAALHPQMIVVSNALLIPNLRLHQYLLRGEANIQNFGRAIQDPWEPLNGFYNRCCRLITQAVSWVFFLAMQVLKAALLPLTLLSLTLRRGAQYIEPRPPSYDHWITPQEQLLRVSNEDARFVDENIATPLQFFRNTSAFPIAKLIAEYSSPINLEAHVRRVFEVLRMFHALPEKIPPLPPNMIEFLNRRCMGCEELQKPDGTFYTFGDLFIPILIPTELGTPNQFQERLSAYALQQGKPPGEFSIYRHGERDKCREKFGEIPFGESRWVLVAKQSLPGTINLEDQAIRKKIDSFCQKDKLSYEVPSWHDIVAAFYLFKVMTGEELFRKEGRQIGVLIGEKLDSEPLGMGIGFNRNLNGSKMVHLRLWRYEIGGAATVRL